MWCHLIIVQVHSHVNLQSMLITFKVGTLATFSPLSAILSPSGPFFLTTGKHNSLYCIFNVSILCVAIMLALLIPYTVAYDIILYIANRSRWKSFAVFVDQSVTMKLCQWNSLCNWSWPCKTTIQLRMFSSKLQFSSATMKLFHLKGFAIATQ